MNPLKLALVLVVFGIFLGATATAQLLVSEKQAYYEELFGKQAGETLTFNESVEKETFRFTPEKRGFPSYDLKAKTLEVQKETTLTKQKTFEQKYYFVDYTTIKDAVEIKK